MVSTRRTPLKAQRPEAAEGPSSQQQQQQQPDQQQEHAASSSGADNIAHAPPSTQHTGAEPLAATRAAGRNAQIVFEMRRKWREPVGWFGRLRLFLRTVKFRTDYILGAYFFDWWETAIVYSLYFVLIAIALVGAAKQLHNLYILARDFYAARWGSEDGSS